MIIVIRSHVTGQTKRIPIHSQDDIKDLAFHYPAVTNMEKHASNPMELLQMFVKYMSSGYNTAHIEDDGYKIKTKEEDRAEKLKWKLVKLKRRKDQVLNKADKIDQGIVTQIKPQTGEMGIDAIQDKSPPYAKRFGVHQAFADEKPSPTLALNMADLDDTQTHKIDDEYFHHIGKKGNHTYHIISRDSNPYAKGLAGIITASHEGKNHIRAAFANTTKDDHLDLLRSHVNAKDEHSYDEPIEIDARKHSEEGWEGHHSDLIHGLIPDKTLQAPPNTVSQWISFAGVKGDETPRVVAKEALRNWERRKGARRKDEVNPTDADKDERKPEKVGDERKGEDRRKYSRLVSYFNDPKFTTAHREAAYAKVANDVFKLGQYVPRTTVFRHPLSDRPWSAMEFVKGATPITPETREKDLGKIKENGDIYKLAIMNMVLGNNDRHMNNVLKGPSGDIHLIDHGLTFDYNHITTGVLPQYVDDHKEGYSLLDEEIPESVHQWLWTIDSVHLANSLHKMNAPHDVIMNAVKRLGEARGWSNDVHHGSRQYKEMNKGLGHLASIIKARNFSVTEAEHGEIIGKIKRAMRAGTKTVKPQVVGDRNIPIGAHTELRTKKQLGGEKRDDIGQAEAIMNAATIAPDQASVKIGDDGKPYIDHPSKEVSMRHETDSKTAGKKKD